WILALAIFLAPAASFAQATKTGGGTTGGGGSSTPPASVDPAKMMNRDMDTLRKTGRAGDRLTGNVTVGGGSVPWDPIAVTVDCDGKERYATTTDGKGFFAINSLDDRGPNTVKADPKPAGWQYVGCSVRAALPGFNSSSLTIGNRGLDDSTNIGTIKLTREENSGGSAVSSTTASAPKDAAKSFEKARAAWLENKPANAIKELQKAVQAYPQFAEAWYQLGRLQEASSPPEAANAFTKAVTADPKYVSPHVQLALLGSAAQRWQDVADGARRGLDLGPRGAPRLRYYNALGEFHRQSVTG